MVVSSLLETYAAAAHIFEIEDMTPAVMEEPDAVDITHIGRIAFMAEPTSSLDVLSEKALLRTLEKISADKTVLIVSHRSSTLTGCNRIAESLEGRLVDTPVYR